MSEGLKIRWQTLPGPTPSLPGTPLPSTELLPPGPTFHPAGPSLLGPPLPETQKTKKRKVHFGRPRRVGRLWMARIAPSRQVSMLVLFTENRY